MNKWVKASEDKALQKAQSCLEEGDTKQARKLCDEALSRDGEDPAALFLRAACSEKNALKYHKAALNIVERERLSADELLELADEAMTLELPGEYSAALFLRAAERLTRASEREKAASAYNKAGVCYYRDGSDYPAEKRCFEKAAELAKKEESGGFDKTLRALINSNLAECYMRTAENEKALELYSEATLHFEKQLASGKLAALDQLVVCRKAMAEIYVSQNNLMLAHSSMSRLISSLEKLKKAAKTPTDELRSHLAFAYNARGTLRFKMGDYAGEVEDCGKSLDFRSQLADDQLGAAVVLCNRAEAYEALGCFEKAREDYCRGIELFKTSDADEIMADAAERSFSLAKLCESNNDSGAAGYYEDAADIFRELRRRRAKLEFYDATQMVEVEALCRFKASSCAAGGERRNYYSCMTQLRSAISLLEGLPPTADREEKLSAMHNSLGELYELFGELEESEKEYLRSDGQLEDCSDEYISDNHTPADNNEHEQEQPGEDCGDDTPKA